MSGKTLSEVELETSASNFFLSAPFTRDRTDIITIGMVIVSTSVVVILTIELRVVPLWIEFLTNTPFLRFSLYPLGISAGVLFLGILFRTILWLKYRPMTLEEGERATWPSVSVIMPAYNEEDLVRQAINSVFAANYPSDRLEVIAIDDGSTDGTYAQMMLAKIKYGNRLKIIRFQKNLGKRRALYSGIKISRGEIIVTVDTDSRIGRDALRNIVLPLIMEPETGAVAGRVAAWNEKENLLTRMLAVRYSVSFDFGRAYQSVYGAVFVCPGALTAYRRSAVLPVLKDWVEQIFMNVACSHGEDRALTTLLLKNGYLTRYQSNAVVYTKVPTSLIQMNRMYLRWTRSYIRESIIFARFMFSRYRKKNRLFPALDFFFLNFLYPFHLFSIALVFYSFLVNPIFILRQLLFLIIISFFLSLYYLRTQRSLTFLYGIPYGIFTALCLWWIFPYSLLTLNEPSWLTR